MDYGLCGGGAGRLKERYLHNTDTGPCCNLQRRFVVWGPSRGPPMGFELVPVQQNAILHSRQSLKVEIPARSRQCRHE